MPKKLTEKAKVKKTPKKQLKKQPEIQAKKITQRVIDKFKKKETKCPSCKSRKKSYKKMMNTRKKKDID